MNEIQATDQKYLVYEDSVTQEIGRKLPLLDMRNSTIWNDRFIFVHGDHTDKNWNFIVFDMLMNDSRPTVFEKANIQANYVDIFPLNDEFGFIVERMPDRHWVISLVSIDWHSCGIHVIEQFERKYGTVSVITNKFKPLEFVLLYQYVDFNRPSSYQICKFVGNKVQFGEIYESNAVFLSYFEGRLFGFKFDEGENNEDGTFELAFYDVITKREESTDAVELPDNILRTNFCCWIKDRLFVGTRIEETRNYGVAWVSFQSRHWTFLDIRMDLRIQELYFFNGNLIVVSKQHKRNDDGIFELKLKIHNVSMRRPEFLRKSVWHKIVRINKQEGEPNPYEAARVFLPIATDLRSPWFEDTESSEGGEDGQNEDDGR